MRLRGRWKTQKLRIVFREAGAGGGAQGRGKPEGVRACEIWVKVGPPAPAKDADWIFQQAAQRSPAEMTSDQEDIGKPIWIRARWIRTKGGPGPWSLAQNTVIA